MYNSQYYTCEQIDQRLLQGYLDDYNTQTGQSLTKAQFLTKLGNIFSKEGVIDNIATQIGYYECDTASGTAAKAITVANYALFAGGSMKVKFANKNTANNATLNINSQGAKALYYQGERASANNSWDAEEVVEIYYDGTSYYANNVKGGSGSGVYDVSKEHPTSGPNSDGKFTLEYILNSSNVNELIPVNKRYPGMSIQFVSTSDNKYVQFRYMSSSTATADFTKPINWEIDSNTAIDKKVGYIKEEGYHIRHTVNTATESPTGQRYSILFHVAKGSEIKYQSSFGGGIFATVYSSVNGALIGDDSAILQTISHYTKNEVVAKILYDGILRLGTKNSNDSSITDEQIADFENSLSFSLLGNMLTMTKGEVLYEAISQSKDYTNEQIQETNEFFNTRIDGSVKNYIVGKKYANNGSLVDDPDYIAILDYYPVTPSSTVTFSLGDSLHLYQANKTFADYFGQTTDPRTVTLNSASRYIRVSYPASRSIESLSIVVNGVAIPIALTEDVLGAGTAKGTSFDNNDTLFNSTNVQNALVELQDKLICDSFVYGKKLNFVSGETIEDADGLGYCSDYIAVPSDRKVTYNTLQVGSNKAIICYNDNKVAFNYFDQTVESRTSTLPDGTAYIRFNFDVSILQKLILIDSQGNNLLPSSISVLAGNFIKYNDKEELGVNNVQDAIKAVVKEMRTPGAVSIAKLYADKEYDRDNLIFKSDFSCFFFSDVHGSINNVNRIVALAKAWEGKVDCIINGGDTIENNSGQDITWYQNIVSAAGIDGVDILTAIGNHDAYTPTGSDGSLNSYNKYIKPTIDNVTGIVHPSDAGTVGKCYYYKDYNEKVRVIVLDAYSPNAYWDSDEETWLQSALEDAITNELAVICVTHVPPASSDFTKIPCTFNSAFSVERWAISEGALTAVQTFIENGGVFAGWLCGHTHYDVFGYPTGKLAQHTFITMSARYNYGPNGFDTPRSGDSTKIDYDSFNLVAVDTENSLFKVLRIGVNLDFKMHTKNILVYDYANREVISNW